MIGYLDKTFCSAGEDCVCPEGRKLTAEVVAAAEEWWGGADAPVAQADLCGEGA